MLCSEKFTDSHSHCSQLWSIRSLVCHLTGRPRDGDHLITLLPLTMFVCVCVRAASVCGDGADGQPAVRPGAAGAEPAAAAGAGAAPGRPETTPGTYHIPCPDRTVLCPPPPPPFHADRHYPRLRSASLHSFLLPSLLSRLFAGSLHLPRLSHPSLQWSR